MKKSFVDENPMKDEMININDNKNSKNFYESFIEKIEYKAYSISCFINSIWEKYSYNLKSYNKEVISIENVYKKKIYMNLSLKKLNIRLIAFPAL
jgi:DNA-directed RNA polymerase alpha subunit